MSRIGRWLRAVSIFTTVTLVVFGVVNLAAYWLFTGLQRKGPEVHARDWFIPPLSAPGQAILGRIYGLDDPDLFVSLFSQDPSIRSHPVLAFAEGLSTTHYEIGVEGVRYQPGWNEDQVKGWLQESGSAVFVLGGSTAFGHGVPGHQTLTAELNRTDLVPYLNLAVQAYDSIREVDKLLYLLRKGYRPRGVVFVDGLNDVTTFAWSNFPGQDKPRTQGLLLDRGEVGLVFGFPRRRNMLAAFLFSLPVVQLAARWRAPAITARSYRERDPATQPMDWRELMYLYNHWDAVQLHRRSQLAGELVDYHRNNLTFLKQLGKAFGFWVAVVYQPIGLLDHSNPFLREGFYESPVYAIYRTVDGRIRAAIESGQLGMIDCSQALVSAPGLGYVDPTHYSPQGNRLLAACIESNLPPLR